MQETIPSIIGAFGGGGAIASLITVFYYQRRRNKKTNSDLIAENYQTLYLEIRTEIGRIRDEQAEERKQWAEERKLWSAERKELSKRVESVRDLLHKKEMEVIELTGKLNVMEVKLAAYDDPHTTGNKNVTVHA